jgi:uncharacterized protein YkwD
MIIRAGALGCVMLCAAGSAAAQDISGEVLSAHNVLRAKHGVPALSWSQALASTAQDWANRCVFEHSSNGLGENLAQGTSGAYSAASFVKSWYDEIRSYDFATGASKDGGVIGHFTQLVWAGTSEVGCGVAQCSGNDLLVCNYNPPGNWDGEYIANVPPAQ